MKNNSKYFKNHECEYFPCHKTDTEYFNCMFCCCPLYALGDQCGGNFVYLEQGIKDCSNCTIPHKEGGYEHVSSKLRQVSEMAKNNRKNK
ncbi:MAG: cysteine-rich small domain-containing protein [Clostridia bacterium]|nr:metal-binding protein [Oscillospiraceae bacterium]MBQ6701901.1 cysteine-rich small domain-containing protein [Clostridia bacterium]